MLESIDLDQYVNFPTYIHFSAVADFKTSTNHSRTVPQTITYRKLKAINIAARKADITNSELIKYHKNSATELAQQYDGTLHTVINLQATLFSKRSSPSLLTHGWLLTSWLLKDIVDIWRGSGIEIRPH